MPPWIERIVRSQPCLRCSKPLKLNMLVGVGVMVPEQPFLGEHRPMAMVMVRCHACTQVSNFISLQELDDILTAARACYDEHANRSYQSQCAHAADNTAQDADSPRGHALDRSAVTDDEVQRFVRLLNRTSFKRQSITFRRWLERLLRGR